MSDAVQEARRVLDLANRGEPSAYDVDFRPHAEEVIRLDAENTILKGIIATNPGIPCVYCGVDNIGKCPKGFPGCGQADDLMVFDDEQGRRLRADLTRCRAALRVARPYVHQEYGIGNWERELAAAQDMIDRELNAE